MPGRGSSETHQCWGVGHKKFALRFSLIDPQREFPALFVLLTVPQAPALHLLLHKWMGVSLRPPIFCQTQKVQFPNSGDGAVQNVNTRARTHMGLAITWLHTLLNNLLDKLTDKPSYCNLQYSSAPREGRPLFLFLCVTFKRKEAELLLRSPTGP